MPEELSTNWLTVPDGLIVVMATDWLIPSFLDQSKLVAMASAYISFNHFTASHEVVLRMG